MKLRGESMQAAADAVDSGMVSVIGLDSSKVKELCAAATERVGADKPVQIANYLCPGNYAVSGSSEVRFPFPQCAKVRATAAAGCTHQGSRWVPRVNQ